MPDGAVRVVPVGLHVAHCCYNRNHSEHYQSCPCACYHEHRKVFHIEDCSYNKRPSE